MKKPKLLTQTAIGDLFIKKPIVEIAGQNRVLIENHQGILAYSPEEIQIKVNYGKISVKGCQLLILQLGTEQLIVGGVIHEIRLLGG